MSSAVEPWTIVPLASPQARRFCRRCRVETPFFSSNRFRVNAHQRRIDAWLIFRCSHCDSVWNAAIIARENVDRIGGDYVRLVENDPKLAERYAGDKEWLRRVGARPEPEVPFDVKRPPSEPPVSAVLRLARPFEVRLDRVLTKALGLSRSQLRRRVRSGGISVDDQQPAQAVRLLRRPARHGQRIEIRIRPSSD